MIFLKRDFYAAEGLFQHDTGVLGAGAVHHKAAADALHGFGLQLLAQLNQGLPGAEGAALLHGAFDELAGFQGIAGLLDGTGDDAILANLEDGLHGVGHRTKVCTLFAGHR